MQQHLIEHAPQNIPIARRRGRRLHRLGNGAAERAGRARVLRQNFASDRRGIGRRGGHARAVGAHDLAPERLLLIADLDHIHLAVQPQVRARHGQRRAPLTRAGLGGHALESLLLGVIRLCDGGVQLVRAGGVVALKFIVNFRRCLQLFFQTVCPHQRRRTVHLVKIADLLRDGDLPVVVIQLLPDQLVTENGAQIVKAHRLTRAGVQQRRGLVFHVRTDVIPARRHLIFRKIDLVRDLFGRHAPYLLFTIFAACRHFGYKNDPHPTNPLARFCWDKGLKPLRCHPN